MSDKNTGMTLAHVICPYLPKTACCFYSLYGEMYRETSVVDEKCKATKHTHAGDDVMCRIAGSNCFAYKAALQKFKENQR